MTFTPETPQERLRAAEFIANTHFMMCSSGLAVLSPTLDLQRVNPALCSMLDYRESDLCSRSWFDLTPPEDRELLLAHCALLTSGKANDNAAQTSPPTCSINQRLRHQNGGYAWVQVTLARYAPDGQVAFFLADIKDTTEQKESYAALVHLNRELETRLEQQTQQFEESRQQLNSALAAAEAANLSKSAFLANMSHELRTPLNAVIGFSRLMAALPSLSADEVRNLEIINRAGNHLLNLINDVLELSKIEAGRVQVRQEAVNIGEMIAEIGDMMGERARSAGLSLAVIRGPEGALPALIEGDSLKLKQILINLIGNAIKFTKTGSVTLKVRKNTLRDLDEVLEFSVHDTGPGIPAEEQQRIFEPFVQLAADARASGTGLGLTICRQYLRLMGSELSLESDEDGTTFRFRLPLRTPAASTPAARKHHVHPVLASADQGKRILMVEDTPEARLLLQCLLEPMGFVLAEAANGEEAVARAADFAPDLILMDWRMPRMDGLEATRRIRASGGKQPRIIMLSANAFEENRHAALEAGADDYLRKPLDADELYQALETQLNTHFVSPTTSAALPAQPRVISLTPAHFSVLDDEERHALKKAIKELNQAKVLALLDQLASDHPQLSEDCRHLVENFDFQRIWHTLEALDASTPPDV